MRITNNSKFKISLPLEIGKAKTELRPGSVVFLNNPVANVKDVLDYWVKRYNLEVDYNAEEEKITLKELKVEPLRILVGQLKALEVQVIPNSIEDSSVKVEILEGKEFVELSDNQEVSGLAEGVAKLKVTSNFDNSVSQEVRVEVLIPVILPTEIEVKEDIEIKVGDKYSLPVSIKPEETTDKNFNITSKTPDIVALSRGKLVGKKAGEAIILVESKAKPELTKEVKITVIE